jgi:hypothetical protein
MYLDDVTVIGSTFEEHLLNPWKVFQWFREALLKLHQEEVTTLSEGSTVPRAYCVTQANTHRPLETEICTGIADPEKYSGNWKIPELMDT